MTRRVARPDELHDPTPSPEEPGRRGAVEVPPVAQGRPGDFLGVVGPTWTHSKHRRSETTAANAVVSPDPDVLIEAFALATRGARDAVGRVRE